MSPHQIPVSSNPPDGWSFTVTEVTACNYRVRAVGPDGVVVERHGLDDDTLLAQVVRDAEKLSAP